MITVALLSALGSAAGAARAQAPDTPEPPAPSESSAGAAQLLSAADAAIDVGDLERAQLIYDQVVRDHPQSPEAREARRALKILLVRPRPGPPTPGPLPEDVVVRQEPYSLRTSERLRLTTWEKLDFGVTSFLYGLSVGFSYGISANNNGENEGVATAAMALGAVTYTLGSVGYLAAAKPSRGDLPLALAIASYVPTTTLLVANVAMDDADDQGVGLATAGAGLVAVPMALLATHYLDLDPGDAQLVRDAGFWGMVLGVTGTLGFGGRHREESFGPGGGTFSFYEQPSTRAISLGGLAGLYGGLALGALAASQSEVSLERVRVSTWGGYGGAFLGGLLMASTDEERDVWRGIAVGGLLGLTLTFVTTGRLDGIPAETPVVSQGGWWRRIMPTVTALPSADGRSRPGLGLAGLLP